MYSGLILQPTYRVRHGVPVVQLYGRLDDGAPFLVEDDRFRPYFFVRSDEVALLEGESVDIHTTPLRDLSGVEVAKVEVSVPNEVPALRDKLRARGAEALEADLRFPYRYLIDRDIRAGVQIDGEPTGRSARLWRFHNPDLWPGEPHPVLSFLSLDIETTPDASEIFSIALAGEGIDEVHLVAESPVAGPVRLHASESDLLRGTAERIREIDPDVIVGWNVVDFDLRVIERRAKELALDPRAVTLGRVAGRVNIQRDLGYMRQARAEVPGRVVLDGLPLAREALRLDDYRLETVARTVLGRGKLIDREVPDAAQEISRMYREDPAALVRYNLEDARLVLEILEHEGLLALTLERSLLSGMPLDRVGASIASFDRLYLPELRRWGRVAPSVDTERKTSPVIGGAVLDSVPGLFRNVAVFDFKSLYPSLVRTFHLDPLAHAAAAEDANRIEAPNGARFSRTDSILPGVIERFTRHRDAAKARGDRHADQAIKIMMNSMFGVFAASACRFFDARVANAITTFGQQTLAWTREAFEAEGVRVLYGDTDSVFVQLAPDVAWDVAVAEAESLRARVDDRIALRIQEEYAVESRLLLESEKVFERFFMPRVRGGRGGTKKRYAGLLKGKLEIVGLETVRRDWPEIAKRLQRGMLDRLFHDRPVVPFVREVADALLAGELDRELVYVKRIRKGSLDRYTASTPPHIQAARKLGEAPGRVIRYLVTRTGPEPWRPGEPLPEGIDRQHYIERVLRPVAESILAEVDESFDGAVGIPVQMSLL